MLANKYMKHFITIPGVINRIFQLIQNNLRFLKSTFRHAVKKEETAYSLLWQNNWFFFAESLYNHFRLAGSR